MNHSSPIRNPLFPFNVGPPDLTLSSMYRGIIPYCIATAAVVVMLMVFPKLAIWLPALMM